MDDSEIWTVGKEQMLCDLDSNDTNTIDIFSLRSVKPSSFLIHKINLPSVTSSQSPLFNYRTNIYNIDYEFFIGNMMLSFTLPPIIGSGTVSYCDYLGYAAIERVNIKIGDAEFVFGGDYLFNQIMSLQNKQSILEDAGHNDFCRSQNTGIDTHECLKDSVELKVLLPLPFGKCFPKNLIPLAPDDNIRVEVSMRPRMDLISHSNNSNIANSGKYSDYNLTLELYTKKVESTGLYVPRIDLPIKTTPSIELVNDVKNNTSIQTINDIPNSRSIHLTQVCSLDDKKYPCLISNWNSEKDVIDNYLMFLTKNLLFIFPDDLSLEDIQKKFPSTAILKEVINGEVVIKIPSNYSQKRVIVVSIKDLPTNHKLYYHTNLLVINKYYDNTTTQKKIVDMKTPWLTNFNISEKVISIIGYYDSNLKSIIPISINHILISQHVSIPLDVYRTLGEDNRINNSTDYVIRCHFTNGPNMFKPLPIQSFILYNNNNSNNNDENKRVDISNNLILNSKIHDNFYMIQPYSPFVTTVYLNFPQNESRFHYNNVKSGKMKIVIHNNNFTCKKSEVDGEYRENKEFREPRHREIGYESLFDNVTYDITTFDSYQISQLNSSGSSSLKKVSSSLIRI